MKIAIAICLAILLSAPYSFAQQQRKKRPHKDKTGKVEKSRHSDTSKNRGPNLVKNGDLEKGSGRFPDAWGGFDAITAIWDKDGHPGKCVMFNTAVLQKDKKIFKEHEDAYKGTSKSGQYDTVGAHEGAWAYAPPVDVSKDDSYFVLSCDALAITKSTEICAPMLLIRGFQRVSAAKAGKNSSWFHNYYKDDIAYSEMFGPDKLFRPSREGDYLMVYRHTLVCRIVRPNEWQHFEIGFKLPSVPKIRPERILLKAYAFWPSGIYKFDNIVLRRSTAEEVKRVNNARQSINAIK